MAFWSSDYFRLSPTLELFLTVAKVPILNVCSKLIEFFLVFEIEAPFEVSKHKF